MMKKRLINGRSTGLRLLMAVLLVMASIINSLMVPVQNARAEGTTGIQHEYTTDKTGTYPTNSWQVTDTKSDKVTKEENVLNYQGGSQDGFDKVTEWDGNAANTENSYLKFGANAADPDYQIRKYAKETATPGLFDVYLNVKGNANETQTVNPIDVVLVVDMSGSMKEKMDGSRATRANTVRTGVRNFLNQLKSSTHPEAIKVGLVGYSSSASVTSAIAPATDDNYWKITGALSSEFEGGTFTQDGIKKAAEMLNEQPNGHQKMIILMTDGVPTYSYRVETSSYGIETDDTVELYGNTFYEPSWRHEIDDPGNTSQLDSSYSDRSGYRIESTWPATLGQARLTQNSGIDMHVLGIQLDNDRRPGSRREYLSKEQVRAKTSKLASMGSNGREYQDADDAKSVTDYLSKQANVVISRVENTISNGSIEDPLGSQFIYAGGPDVHSVSTGDAAVANLPVVSEDPSSRKISVKDLNLGKGQEVQIHYQVHLNTEAANFKPDHWYQLNGTTTLTPNGSDSKEVEFGVPSAKAAGTTIKVTKDWADLEKNKRPESIGFTVIRQAVDTQGSTDAWSATGTLSGAKTENSWEHEFAQLTQANQTVSLAKFNNQGQIYTYQVESEVVTGENNYRTTIANSVVAGISSSEITNTQYGITFAKYAKGTDTALTGAVFTITNTDTKKTQELSDELALQVLKPGPYTIQETKAPTGYRLDGTAYAFILSKDGQWQQPDGKPIAATESSEDSHADGLFIDPAQSTNKGKNNVLRFVKNDEKNLRLKVVKTDGLTDQPLSGAQFTLNDEGLIATDDGTSFEKSDFKSGTYTLTETKAPNGYDQLAAPIKFEVDAAGNATITSTDPQIKKLVTISSKVDEQTGATVIILTIKNATTLVLPHTGGPGQLSFMVAGILLLFMAASVIIVFERHQREVNDNA
ncbi:SpaA isopeptide-forming pilin-related protein [Lapidilactobacillus luobeiensis]|uniref:SpaA isopeptide-forming pilin-related protein n=1 Tax=Lapidilactobacillus luobeiensis TaxID=2950371 RepID=UPI0021C37583|nr:SpaA isopeptide-forming pilin-related protein [Lapidilactobacillus luobeiensis]